MADLLWGLDSSGACASAALSSLRLLHIRFIGRYYSRTTTHPDKVLKRAEAQLISQSRIQLVTVYEDAPTSGSYFSADRGAKDAAGALQQAAAAGQPQGSAIYFTVDYDAPASDHAAIQAYFAAVASTIAGKYRVGVYGSGDICTLILGAGSAALAWLAQSTGWSGYDSFTRWNINQGPETSVCGLNSDLDVARGDFGAFTVSS
jgi:hypothetical protein